MVELVGNMVRLDEWIVGAGYYKRPADAED